MTTRDDLKQQAIEAAAYSIHNDICGWNCDRDTWCRRERAQMMAQRAVSAVFDLIYEAAYQAGREDAGAAIEALKGIDDDSDTVDAELQKYGLDEDDFGEDELLMSQTFAAAVARTTPAIPPANPGETTAPTGTQGEEK